MTSNKKAYENSIVGKPNTFEECLNQFSPMIKSIIKKLRIYKSFEEYYQIGQIALWIAYENYQSDKGSFSNFAYLTVRGYILNEMTKESNYEGRNIVVESHKESLSYRDEAFALEQFHSHIKGVSKLQQSILFERFYLNREFSEIAKKHNMLEKSVRSSYRYALLRLRNRKMQS